jgi:hypothetical protein
VGEIEKCILKLRASNRRRSQKRAAWLESADQSFAVRILPLDAAALPVWSQLAARSKLAYSAGSSMISTRRILLCLAVPMPCLSQLAAAQSGAGQYRCWSYNVS